MMVTYQDTEGTGGYSYEWDGSNVVAWYQALRKYRKCV